MFRGEAAAAARRSQPRNEHTSFARWPQRGAIAQEDDGVHHPADVAYDDNDGWGSSDEAGEEDGFLSDADSRASSPAASITSSSWDAAAWDANYPALQVRRRLQEASSSIASAARSAANASAFGLHGGERRPPTATGGAAAQFPPPPPPPLTSHRPDGGLPFREYARPLPFWQRFGSYIRAWLPQGVQAAAMQRVGRQRTLLVILRTVLAVMLLPEIMLAVVDDASTLTAPTHAAHFVVPAASQHVVNVSASASAADVAMGAAAVHKTTSLAGGGDPAAVALGVDPSGLRLSALTMWQTMLLLFTSPDMHIFMLLTHLLWYQCRSSTQLVVHVQSVVSSTSPASYLFPPSLITVMFYSAVACVWRTVSTLWLMTSVPPFFPLYPAWNPAAREALVHSRVPGTALSPFFVVDVIMCVLLMLTALQARRCIHAAVRAARATVSS